MSSVADSDMIDDYAAAMAAASLEERAYRVADRAEILHASEAQVKALYEGAAAGAIPVAYDARQGWLIDDMPVSAWVQQQQQAPHGE